MRVWRRSFDAGALENALERGSRDRSHRDSGPTWRTRRDTLWRSVRLSERGRGWSPSLALAYRPRDAPLQFPKISIRYHNTSRLVAEFFQKIQMVHCTKVHVPSNYRAGACAIGVRIGAGRDDHHRRRHDIDGVRIRTQIDTPAGEPCARRRS